VYDPIVLLKQLGYGIHISPVFFGCLFHANDISTLVAILPWPTDAY